MPLRNRAMFWLVMVPIYALIVIVFSAAEMFGRNNETPDCSNSPAF